MGQSLLWTRSSIVPPLLTRNCARVYPARGSNVPKYRYPHQRATTSYPSRIWRSKSAYGGCPSNTTTARLDTDGFSVGGNRHETTPVGNKWSTSYSGHIDWSHLTTTPAYSKRRFIALIAVAKALACSKGMRSRHLAQGYQQGAWTR